MRKQLAATAVLLIMFALAVSSLAQTSPTFDEQGFVTRGLGYVRGENQWMRVGHPLGLNALNASLLWLDESVQLPTSDPSWLLPSFHRSSEIFLWEIGNDVAHVMFLARLPTIWLGLMLAALAGRWAWELARNGWAALLALALVAFDPNILAHTRLATTDLGLTFFAFLSGYTLWRFGQRPSWSRALFAGIAFGLLQNTKFTAGLFVPLFALMIIADCGLRISAGALRNPQSAIRNLLMLVVAYVVVAPFTLWAAYGFQVGTLPQWGGLTVPLSHHLEQLLDIGGRLQKSTPAFLLGSYSDNGWWYYFPVAFLLKTPLPTLLLLVWATARYLLLTISSFRNRWQLTIEHWQLTIFLLIPALGYFAIALTTDINLGYRHLLPTLPFLFVFTAVTLLNSQFKIHKATAGRPQYIILSVLLWLFAATLWFHPHYLAFFNILAGGPDGGWRYLVDSNLDWGQDLSNLRQWMDENGRGHVWLSYFGEGRPEYYGIDYTGLDSWPPSLMDPEARPFYPHDPAPGLYAISATTLQGVHFADHDRFAWFRERDPVAKIGYSIFMYDVKERGAVVDVSLGGLQIDELAPADFARFQSNRVTLGWFDPATAVLIPESDNRWVVLPAAPVLADEWPNMADWELVVNTEQYRLYRLSPMDDGFKQPRVEFTAQGGTVGLLNWQMAETAVPGQPFTLQTHWFKTSSPEPLKMFIHITNPAGDIVAQWDSLGVKWQGWRPQSLLQQAHTIPLPADMPPGRYQVRAGLYNPENGRRLLTTTGADFTLLGQLTIDN